MTKPAVRNRSVKTVKPVAAEQRAGRKRRGAACWSKPVGQRGYQVTIYERRPGGNLWLRWWIPKSSTSAGRFAYRPLEHTDRTVAEKLASEIAGGLLASTISGQTGRPTVADVLAAYKSDVVPRMSGNGPKEAERRIAMWISFLGAGRHVDTIDKPLLDSFEEKRLKGEVPVPAPFKLKPVVTRRTAGADLEFLRAALLHATTKKLPSGKFMLTVNPMAGYTIPENTVVNRPVATYERYLAIRKAAKSVDEQQLLPHFMTLIEGFGWRVSAICSLYGSDVDLTRSPSAPLGRLRKDPKKDKQKNGGWVPVGSKDVRRALEALTKYGTIRPTDPLFPAPLACDEDGTPCPWSRHHARKLFKRAERHAKLQAMAGGNFHPFRRKWATERKHFPVQDVAAAGAWLDLETVRETYQHSDPQTILEVMTSPKKLREKPPTSSRRNMRSKRSGGVDGQRTKRKKG